MKQQDSGWTVITGSTGGIGSEIVQHLAGRGIPMVWVNRSKSKAEAQRSRVVDQHPGLAVELVTADLLDSVQVAQALTELEQFPHRIDALYNNAGLLTGNKVLSSQGHESQFAVNTLAPFQLIRGLESKMARSANMAPGMIVNFSSSAIERVKELDVDDLANPQEVGGLLETYARTKLAVTALAPALADRLKSENILIRAIDPGATNTEMTTGENTGMPRLLRWLAPLLFRPASQQASKLIASAQPEAHQGRSGIYVASRKQKRMPALAADEGNQTKLLALLNGLLEAASNSGK